MARISRGILGGFSGTVGTVVGSSWRGIEYMRSKPRKRRTGNSKEQVAQQSRFGLMTAFLKTMKDLVVMGFPEKLPYMTELNSALSFNLKNAITGTYPDFSIVYPQVQITRGSLPNVTAPTAAAGAAGTVMFNWIDNTGIGKAKAEDKAILVAHCELLKQTVYITGPMRSAGTASLAVPEFAGQTVQTWISFVTTKGDDIATSIFTGVVNVL